jgi:hypothetical protein
LFFRVDNFEVALPRGRALVSRLEKEPHVNPNTGTMEFSLRDPDGYFVTISALEAAGHVERSHMSALGCERRIRDFVPRLLRLRLCCKSRRVGSVKLKFEVIETRRRFF